MRPERGVGPVVHRPGAQLRAVQADAREPATVRSQRLPQNVFLATHSRSSESTTTYRGAFLHQQVLLRPAPPATPGCSTARRAGGARACRPTAARGRPAGPRRAARPAAPASAAARWPRTSCPARRAAAPAWRAGRRAPARRAAGGAHVVPGFVRQALDVVGQVAGQIDDRGAEAGLRLDAALGEARLDERRRRRRPGIFSSRITGPAL